MQAVRQAAYKQRVLERDSASRDFAFGQWLNRGICEAAHVHPACVCLCSRCVCVSTPCRRVCAPCVAVCVATAAAASPQGRFHLHLLQFCCISVSAGVAALMLLRRVGGCCCHGAWQRPAGHNGATTRHRKLPGTK